MRKSLPSLLAFLFILGVAAPFARSAPATSPTSPQGAATASPAAQLHGGPDATPTSAPTLRPHGGPAAHPTGNPTSNPQGGPAAHPTGAPASNPHGAPASNPHGGASPAPQAAGAPASDEKQEAILLKGIHQLTFDGLRAGEGYFSADGTRMVFQSERDPKNPFYQIFLMDLRTGDVRRVSTGTGKTTCAWIHPDGKRVLFASTHRDPAALEKQDAELKARAAATQRRYAWDFDENYQIYSAPISAASAHAGQRPAHATNGGPGVTASAHAGHPPAHAAAPSDAALTQLTNARGYNAEASWSPDGKWIVFASNRHAYSAPLSPQEKALFDKDPSSQLDIYRMRADGSDVQRLTRNLGYDGGPFYSADGSRICWRRFRADGAVAEIFTMKADGTDEKQLTRLGVMSWAPYFHPSGDYLVFATNKNGHANFEVYMVDAAGQKEPVRVTWTDGFDGLPVFAPDGRHLAWTSSRTADRKPQIFIADWDDAAARRLLGLAPSATWATPTGSPTAEDKVRAQHIRRDVVALTSPGMDGRLTGTPGEQKAADHVAALFKSLGLEPAGDGGTYFQAFPFTAGVSVGPANSLRLRVGEREIKAQVEREWRPLAFSRPGACGPAGVAFVGYGIVAPATNGHPAYDSYGSLDVKGRWVLMFRYMPEDVPPTERQYLAHYAGLRYKAMQARDRGALGVIVVSGPRSGARDPLVKLSMDAAMSGTSLVGISIRDELASDLLAPSGQALKTLQEKLDRRDDVPAFAIPGATVEAAVDIRQEKRTGHNVLARLPAVGQARKGCLVVGAHLDHLGHGLGGNSLARGADRGLVHPGADDNASGVATMLEVARHLAALRKSGALDSPRDIVFAAWSGEELGVLGSSHFVRTWRGPRKDASSLAPGVVAYLNMDMVGRLKDRVILQGMGSSSTWPTAVERADVPVGLAVSLQQTSYLPTDATPFYVACVPILNAFTGAHSDYHTPTDTAEKLSYEGAALIAHLVERVASFVAMRAEDPDYRKMEKPTTSGSRAGLRVFLGTIPDYGGSEGQGLRLSGVVDGGPADKAGLRAGDVIVELAGRKIEGIHDYAFVLETLKVGQAIKVVVRRGHEQVQATLVPGQRD